MKRRKIDPETKMWQSWKGSEVGVRHMGFHALRHAGTTLMDSANVPLGSIQRLLGHEHRSTEIYWHSLGELEREAWPSTNR